MIIDLGCGWFKVPNAVGIDLFHYNNDVIATAFQTPLQSGSVDIVIARQLIEHLDTERLLKECWRILKPNGVIHLETPNALFLFKVLRAFRGLESNPHKEHIQTYSAGEVRNLLTRNGFTDPEISYRSYEVFKPYKNAILRVSDCLFPMLGRDLIVTARKYQY